MTSPVLPALLDKVPVTVSALFDANVIPFERVIVRLFNPPDISGKLRFAPDPPTVMLLVPPPVKLPVPAIAPGLTIQLPAGKPVKTTLPVDTVQVGCVTVPTIGADGVMG